MKSQNQRHFAVPPIPLYLPSLPARTPAFSALRRGSRLIASDLVTVAAVVLLTLYDKTAIIYKNSTPVAAAEATYPRAAYSVLSEIHIKGISSDMNKKRNDAARLPRTYHMTRRRFYLLLIDAACFFATWGGEWLLRILADDASIIPVHYLWSSLFCFAPIFLIRVLLRVYENIWRYANARAYAMLVIADFTGGLAGLLLARLFRVSIGVWYTVSAVGVFCLLTLFLRFGYQLYMQSTRRHRLDSENGDLHKTGVAIVGAGQVGVLLARELFCNPNSGYRPVCFIDKDPEKIGSIVEGLKVLPEGEGVFAMLSSLPVQEIVIALPRLDGSAAAEVLKFYSRKGYKVKLYGFPLGHSDREEDDHRVLREFKIEDLLFRNEITVGPRLSGGFYHDKVILVTGGGGSIGSELCRQIAACHPRRLVIFDIYENNAYDIQQELIYRYHDSLPLSVEIGSVRDRDRLDDLFDRYRPDIVFHAAAHKHVPLMEHSDAEAVKNNVLGTRNVADMAEKYRAAKFILVSTDKAVNPTNVMGASKRMCEMVIQCRGDSATTFAAVRFGNVLGSNGSVIPLFRRQIANGGPVTITDRRIVRYFMTIPEAVRLVMQAGAMAAQGELFVLDMGKPVRILDLAENMVRLSGFVPYQDIDIREIGLRPGEKLYEELLIKTEKMTRTDNDMIFIEQDTPLSREEVKRRIAVLTEAVEQAHHHPDSDLIKQAFKQVVETYHDPETVNCTAEQSEEMQNTRVVSEETDSVTETD